MSNLYNTIVIGDSLACPRPSENVNVYDTYAYQLQKLLAPHHYVLNWSVNGNSSSQTIASGLIESHLHAINTDFAVIQLGIVDCAPRLMSNTERLIGAVLTKLPVFRSLFKKYTLLKSKYRLFLTKLFPIVRTSRPLFRENYKQLISEILKSDRIQKIYLINIASPSKALVEKSYGVHKNINDYNQIINELHQLFHKTTILIDLNTKTSENLHWISLKDGHHILKPAHDWLTQIIGDSILSLQLSSKHDISPSKVSNETVPIN